MDAKQTLLNAQYEISEGYVSEAISSLHDYFEWRLKGGAEPKMTLLGVTTPPRFIKGDKFALELLDRIPNLLK